MDNPEDGGTVQSTVPHTTHNPALYGGLALVIVIALAAAYWWWASVRQEKSVSDIETTAEEKASESFGGEVSRLAEEPVRKAAESIPDTNPLGGIKSNPYDGYKNPFSR